jgi:hypothetical protein
MNKPTYLVEEQPVPDGLQISKFLPGAHFADSYTTLNPLPELCAMELFLRSVNSPPRWVNALMSLRNQAVRLVGLKNLGALHETHSEKRAEDYRPGDRAGIFTVLYVSEGEVVLGDKDKHLEVRVSVSKLASAGATGRAPQLQVTTIVHEHNRLGKLYMLVVGPIHKRVVPAVLRRGLRGLIP